MKQNGRKAMYEEADGSEQSYVPRIQKKSQKSYNRWKEDENLKYIEFLQNELDSFDDEYQRRTKKVFKRLAQFVGSRDHSQCKSHHQKLIKLYKSPKEIILALNQRLNYEENENSIALSFGKREETKSCIQKSDSIFSGQSIGNYLEDDIFNVLNL